MGTLPWGSAPGAGRAIGLTPRKYTYQKPGVRNVCGIAGILNFDGSPVARAALVNMTNAMAHRGPDGEGHYVDGALGLGHRRLAILDLSAAGNQPMANERGDLVLTYNGEIYNHKYNKSHYAY